MIDEYNYKGYFLDFLEGKLTDLEVENLMTFLEKNPTFEDNLLHFDQYAIESNSDITISKKILLKSLDHFESINDSNLDEFCIAFYEKDLSASANEKLLKYLDIHPERVIDFDNYGKVYIKPQINLKFPTKSKLKRFNLLPLYRIFAVSASVAACLLLLIYLIPSFNQITSIATHTIAITKGKSIDNLKEQSKNLNVVLDDKLPLSRRRNQIISDILHIKQITLIANNKTDSLYKEEINIKSINSLKINILNLPISNENTSLLAISLRKNPYYPKVSFLSIREFAIRKLHKAIEPNLSDKTEDYNITWWDIAKLGVTGINKLTGSEIKVDRKINEEGKIVAMVVESGNLGFSRSISK
jgi:hypothetical protein